MRVQKVLSNIGFCSRRSAEKLISEGKVKVNGKTVSIGDQCEITDKITVDGKKVKVERKVYLVLNKPLGCVTALTDKHYPTVMQYIRVPERIFPIGRLDKDTSGILLFTNDGDFANRIAHPSFEVEKEYLVKTDKELTASQIKDIAKGVKLDDGIAKAKIRKKDDRYSVILHMGKTRIVRRIFEKFKIRVLALHRIRIGSLKLTKLASGKSRELTSEEVNKFETPNI